MTKILDSTLESIYELQDSIYIITNESVRG